MIISIIKCEVKFVIHFQASTMKLLKFLEWISNFIPHISGHVIVYDVGNKPNLW